MLAFLKNKFLKQYGSIKIEWCAGNDLKNNSLENKNKTKQKR